MIFAHGSRFGGHALFLKDSKLWYVYNFLGIPPEQQFVSERARARPARARHGVRQGVGSASTTRRTARRKLYVDDEVVAEGPMRTQLAQFTLCGDGLCVGRDSRRRRERASTRRRSTFTGGTICKVEVNVGDDQYVDLESQAAAMMARETERRRP